MAQNGPWNDYPAAASPAEASGPWSDYANAQATNPTINTSKLEQSIVNNLPAIGGIGGGLIGGPVGAGVGGAAGQAAQDYMNNYTNPDKTPETTAQKIYQPILSGALQGGGQYLGEAAAPYIGKALSSVPGLIQGAKDATAKAAGKVADFVTGINEDLSSNYFQNTDKINSLINQ